MYLMFTGRATALDYILFAVFYAIQMFGVSIGFHRYLAHKAFKTSRFFEGVLMITGSMALEGPVLFWVSTHRRHHRFSDEAGDPHSPNLSGAGLRGKLKGLWYAHIPWMFSDEESRATVFAPDVVRDRRLYYYNRTYPIWALASLLFPAFSASRSAAPSQRRSRASSSADWHGYSSPTRRPGASGPISHMVGSRPFATKDDSANNWPVAIFTFGEGLQNNHHAFPGAYRHAMRWWEPDLSGWVIAMLAKTGVVWDLKMPDRDKINSRLRRNRTTSMTGIETSRKES